MSVITKFWIRVSSYNQKVADPEHYPFQASLPASPVSYGFRRLGLGVVYMLIHLIGAMYFPLMWPASPAFLTHNILLRFLLLGLWGKVNIPVLLIRILRIRMFLGLLNPDPVPLVRGMDPDPVNR